MSSRVTHPSGNDSGYVPPTARARSVELLQAMVDLADTPVWCCEFDPPVFVDSPLEDQIRAIGRGLVVECNSSFARQVGLERSDQVRGSNLIDSLGQFAGDLDSYLSAFIQADYSLEGSAGADGRRSDARHRGVGMVEGGRLLRMWGAYPKLRADEAAPVDSDAERARLRESLQRQQGLLRSVHHRANNNLQIVASMLNLQARRGLGPEVDEALKSAAGRVRAIAQVHELGRSVAGGPDVQLGAYMEALLHCLQKEYPSEHIRFDLVNVDALVSLDKVVPLGLITHELVTNSIVHAFPHRRRGAVRLRLRLEDQELVLTVHDDGIGMPEQYRAGFGLELVQLLAEQLSARFVLDDAYGTRAELAVPLSALHSDNEA